MKMKSLVRWCLALSVAGITLSSSLFSGTLKALALTETQIVERLKSIPVFAVADENGAPLVARIPQNAQSTPNADSPSVAGVFINPIDAQAFITRLKQENPSLGNKLQIIPVSLGDIYQLDRRNNQQEGVNFTYVPTNRQVELAQQLNPENFQGVPLFIAKAGAEGGYLTLQQNEEQVIPFFFEKEGIEQMVERFKEQQPSLANTIQIQAVPLEGVIQTLEQNDNAELQKIVLIPTQASLEYINTLRQQNQR
ncbi:MULTISPECIES: Tic22 family protein [Spirulina sp. CCY15215]|uniref:Tic22 family protein n=1 Tax=Spirulina sp. CCY15215 TaxID=2767591 RepID=UPI001EF36A23|nr:Tic22 family protein [Spirulina major]